MEWPTKCHDPPCAPSGLPNFPAGGCSWKKMKWPESFTLNQFWLRQFFTVLITKSFFGLLWAISKASPKRAWFWAGIDASELATHTWQGWAWDLSHCFSSPPFNLHVEDDGKVQPGFFWTAPVLAQPKVAATNTFSCPRGKGRTSAQDRRLILVLLISHIQNGELHLKQAWKRYVFFTECLTTGSRHLSVL